MTGKGRIRRATYFSAAILLLLLLLPTAKMLAQMPEKDVRARLERVYQGRAGEVRTELPALLAKYPDDAGVRFLEALLTQDGAQAAQRYSELVRKFPESVWAAEALYKVYQYDFSNGLYKKADSVMAFLRTKYPASAYAKAGNGTLPAKEETQTAAAKEKPNTQTPPPAKAKEKAGVLPPSSSSSSKSGAPPVGAAAATGSGYDVQAGLFSTEGNARAASERLSKVTGRQARVRKKAAADGRTVYLVVFEGFPAAESARRFSGELRTKHGIDSFVNPR